LCGCWVGGGGLALRCVGHSLAGVLHVGDEARVGVGHRIGDRLRPAVGQQDGVRAAGQVAIARLLSLVLGAGIVVVDGVAVRIRGRLAVAVIAGVVGSIARRR